MYKSAVSNCKSVDKFEIRDLKYDRRRKNLIIEPNQIKIGEKISYKKHNFINQPFICF